MKAFSPLINGKLRENCSEGGVIEEHYDDRSTKCTKCMCKYIYFTQESTKMQEGMRSRKTKRPQKKEGEHASHCMLSFS
jgi:hypothetical protein